MNNGSAWISWFEVAHHVAAKQAVANAHVADATSFFTPAGLEAIAVLLSAILWPAVVLFLIFAFRPQVARILDSLTEFELPGVKAKIQRRLDAAAGAAGNLQGLSTQPTPAELRGAKEVEVLAGSADISLVRRQIEELAAEYERVRASMPPSRDRTREMEKVVAKMRVIGRAASPLRHELSTSASPGKRLQAVAILQVEPDEDYFNWLVDRVAQERPFIGYHATVALVTATRQPDARRHLAALQQAAERSVEVLSRLPSGADREVLLKEFQSAVQVLRAGAEPPAEEAAG